MTVSQPLPWTAALPEFRRELGAATHPLMVFWRWLSEQVPGGFKAVALVDALHPDQILSSDGRIHGLRFVVPVRTIHAGWNSKYFGAQRGMTYLQLHQ